MDASTSATDIRVESLLSPFSLDREVLKGCSTSTRFFAEGSTHKLCSPVDGQYWAEIQYCSSSDYETAVEKAKKAALHWRKIPSPKRGQIIGEIGNKLRRQKEPLSRLVSYEMGKPLEESRGEVQEMIDICDYAIGLSRQLHGLTMHSERFSHRMYEQYHPLGLVGIISAFNFPVAVWSWNAMIAWVCGNVCLWKPSEKTPVSAVAVQKIVAEVFESASLPEGVSTLIVGDASLGEKLASDRRIDLLSATGSVRMGKKVAQIVASRLGRSLLELGGNNALIVSEKGRLQLALRAALFGAVGTAGQRCTTTRRIIVHNKIYDQFVDTLSSAYEQLRVGNPLDERNHLGPLVDEEAVKNYMKVATHLQQTAQVKERTAAKALKGEAYTSGCYVRPSIYEVQPHLSLLQEETFAPLLYVMPYEKLEEAITWQNNVPQGLSSAIISDSLQEVETFLSHRGSDCGIANVNIGTSGAEIGGAFGGEKDTGGGREAGSDSWKSYMRRQTNTINYGEEVPLAQGIRFSL